MHPKSVVTKFVESLASSGSIESTIAIKISNDPALELLGAEKVVEGFNWLSNIKPTETYDFITIDLPLGMRRKKINLGDVSLSVRGNWLELYKALCLLSPQGLCAALLEPPAFGISEGTKFQQVLAKDGYYLNGVFNAPPNLLTKTVIRPVIAVFSRNNRTNLFVAELQDEAQVVTIAQSFMSDVGFSSLNEGMLVPTGTFDGFESLKSRIQLDRLETQYKEYRSYALGDIAVEMNVVRPGESLEHKENSIYVPMIGASLVSHELSAVTIKHQNIIQVVLSDAARSDYVAAFFRSDLGLLILRSLTRGSMIPRIGKADLFHAQIAVPNPEEQAEIVRSHSQLQALTDAIGSFQRELALNPRSASAIRGQLEGMLETIGRLSEADRIMSLARQGESATVEFKESFSLHVKEGTKEKFIEVMCLKTIVAFLNTRGGILLIGINDAGDIPGVHFEVEKFYKNNDRFLLHFKNQLKQRVGEQYYPFIDQRLVEVGGAEVLMVECKPSTSPCFLDEKDFYVRTNPATDKLEGQKLYEYVQNHFSK